MEPWISWALALGVGGGLALYYTSTGKPKSLKTAAEPPHQSSSRRRQDKRARDEPSQTSTATSTGLSTPSASTEKKRKAAAKPQEKAKPAPRAPESFATVAANDEPAGSTEDDKAWAQQLSAAQKGVDLRTVSKTDAPRVKSSKKKQRAEEVTDSAAWSSGAEHEPSSSKTSGDVSDMLETPTAGPSVLRLTGEEKAKKQSAAKAEVAKETKKQRQNRRKAEEKKAAQNAAEEQRKVLAEQQRRGAREARGEPAKNGIPVAPAPGSAWTQAGAAPKANGGMQPADGALLDTFDHEALSATSSNEPHTSATTPATAASTLGAYDQADVAQLDEISRLTDNSAGWNEVGKTKKGKKKASATASPPAEPNVKEMHTYSSAKTDELVNSETKAPGLPVKETKASNLYDTLNLNSSFAPGMGSRHPQDSDWAA